MKTNLILNGLILFILRSEITSYVPEVKLSFVGDILINKDIWLQNQYEGSILGIFKKVRGILKDTDFLYGNLECAVADIKEKEMHINFEKAIPGIQMPAVVCPKRIIWDLISLGFDFVSVANNHVYDRSSEGINETIETLKSYGLKFSGIKKENAIIDDLVGFYKEIKINGLNSILISCTIITNNEPDELHYRKLLNCDSWGRFLIKLIIQKKRENNDLVIVFMHYGKEYSKVTKGQSNFVKDIAKAGADIIIGNHPHIPQKFEIIKNEKRNTLVVYSIGNFVSNNRHVQIRHPEYASNHLYTQFSTIFNLIIEKNDKKVILKDFYFIPIWMKYITFGNQQKVVPISEKFSNCDKFIIDVEEKQFPKTKGLGRRQACSLIKLYKRRNLKFYDEDFERTNFRKPIILKFIN